MDYEYSIAKRIADELLERLRSSCVQVEIAGSIRRRAPWVHDIEIVAEPWLEVAFHTDLFGEANVHYASRLDDTLADLQEEQVLRSFPGAKHGDRFKQFAIAPTGITLDLFIVRPPAQWGSIYAIRTGPAHYSHWLVTPRRQGGAMPSYFKHRDGGLYEGDTLFPTPTEASFFAALDIHPVPYPWDREPAWHRHP
jgi:DNA polymerase/3'-5' exonuclease PolX